MLPLSVRLRQFRALRPLIDAPAEAWLLFGTMALGWGLIATMAVLHVLYS